MRAQPSPGRGTARAFAFAGALAGVIVIGVVVAVALVNLRPSAGVAGTPSTATSSLIPSPSLTPWASPTPSPLSTPVITPAPVWLQTPSPVPPPTPTPFATPTPVPYTEPTPPPLVLGDFTTNAPPSDASTWRSLTWRKLAADDPLTAVRSVVRWRGGYIALGDELGPDWQVTRTPVWVSSDGVSWRLLPPQVFGPSTVIAGTVEVGGRLVAVGSEGTGDIRAWVSSDGVAWTVGSIPDLALSGSGWYGPLVAAGPGGVVVAVMSEHQNADGTWSGSSLAAISADGEAWTPVGSNAFPADFCIGDLWGRADGYVAVGSLGPNEFSSGGIALWSWDGTNWAPADGPIVAALSDNPYGRPWVVGGVAAGSAGAIALGGVESAPGKSLWWQSSDGRHWTELSDYPPLGVYPGPGVAALLGEDGWLGADGTRLVALRTWTDPAVWVSFDGASWSSVTMSGDLPTGTGNPDVAAGCCQPLGIRVLPGGILFGNGSTTWYGTAAGT